jgi:hypothetical protein
MNDDERKRNTARRAERILEIAAAMAAKVSVYAENRIEEIQLHYNGYAEPGYSAGEHDLVATGNWNKITQYDAQSQTSVLVSNLPKRIADLFEKMGIECEWSDEWTECNHCGKIVRNQGDSYHWTPSFFWSEQSGDVSCIECLLKDPEDFLSELEDNENVANTMEEIDPAKYGYIQINEDSYETGWYPGQHDNPSKIAKELRKKGITKFLFNIDSVGQFDSHWSVYVHEDEEHLLNPIADEEDEVVSFNKETDALLNVVATSIHKLEIPCKVCKTQLWQGETPCWKCGTNDPTT